jgi:ABC-2 type transport system ATP-binding protein
VSAVDVAGLQVSYRRHGHAPVHAVRHLDLTVAEGEIVGLLGPNGAGKTSTLQVLEGYLRPTAGRVRVLGLDPAARSTARRLREQIGIVLQDSAVDPYLTVREVLTRNAGYYPRPRDVDDTIALVGLADKSRARVRTLSGGQVRRLDLALGLIGSPRLLFLDEPTTGFDPGARRASWDLVRGLRELGTTILLTTHYMEEAQALADRVLVIADGQAVAAGAPDDLGGRSRAAAQVRFTLPVGVDPARVPSLHPDVTAYDGRHVTVTTEDATRTLHALTGWALQRGTRLEGLVVVRPSLEDVYLELTGATRHEAA